MSAKPRFDFYQTDTVVNVSIYVKNARQEDLVVDISEKALHVKAHSQTTGSEHVLDIDPLFSTVDKTSSGFKVFSTKIDVTLHKAHPGQQWAKLEANSDAVASAATPSYSSVPPATDLSAANHASNAAPLTATSTSASSKTPAPRPRSKWDSFKAEDEDAEAVDGAANGGEADINKFFQRLYADADEDTRRAMMKSYQESGGTTLSTDWSKVGKAPVETKPPEGMEARKWE